ncbi:type IV pilus modification protein PilV [Neptunomonas concharum]|uniref:Type IV pilus modification protein PilV n=2 Tax=Neptunomonas concharum TaxID=1031538 RepID=A0A5P1RFP0_9GAMM|nr:type IV pilus modification protein PilV [Neptunomonas concharum]
MIDKAQQGATLIEILITVLVMSVGLVGMATLQFDAVKLNNDALLRTKAVNLANDMADRIRANPDAAEGGDYDFTLGATAPTSPADTAEQDQSDWLAALANELPSGQGSIAVSTVGNISEVNIQVCWDEDRSGTQPATCFTFVSGL